MQRIDYSETDKRLAVRIRAHTQFATFSLEQWLAGRLSAADGSRILDVACGDGNYFPIYASLAGSRGVIAGFDKSDSLLAAAQQRMADISCGCVLFKWDFDHPLPLLAADFDCTVCFFAAYYAKDAQAWVDEALRVTRPGGQILLLGPASDNAKELYELNERVSGLGSIEETDFTTHRLTSDFIPAMRRRRGETVVSEIIDRRIVFPSPREFAEYYLATWLYEKSSERAGRQWTVEEVEQQVVTTTLSKRVVALEVVA